MSLKEGDKAPDFELQNENGEKTKLKDLKGKKVVLYFYPKDLTSGCTQQACDFRDSISIFKKKKAVVIGVSKDDIATHGKFINKYDLPFSLLSDPKAEICSKYGVWKEKSMYGRKYMGIERTTFVISEQGKIEKIFHKVKVKAHIEEVLESL